MTFMRQTSLASSKTQNQFLSVMFGIGGTTGGNKSGSVGASKGSSDRQWVDNASSIIGTESVDIDVDSKLKMEGSMIANIDKDGKDSGNLDIKAGSIETSDISNYDRNSNSGISIDTNLGGNPAGTNDGYDKGRVYIETEIGSMSQSKGTSINVENVSSTIRADGNVNIGATENVNIKGSNIFSDENIEITASKDINIISSHLKPPKRLLIAKNQEKSISHLAEGIVMLMLPTLQQM